MSFGALALVMAAALAGPGLAGASGFRVPVVVGELVAGVVIGVSGFGWIDPGDPALAFLGQVGFAVVMLIAGTHLPLRTPGLRGSLKGGAAATALTFALALPVAVLLRHVTSLHDTGILLVLLGTSSAAVVVPVLADSGGLTPQGGALAAVAWVALADVASVVAVPLVLAQGGTGRVVAGGLLILTGAVAVFVAIRALTSRGLLVRAAKVSVKRGWALRLRVSLVVLFALAWIATQFHTSVLIAGFSLGAVISILGEPRTVARELIGVGEGFLVPVFFVLLGARIDVRALVQTPGNLALMGTLVAATVALHLLVARVTHLGTPAGLLASAQLGVPAAVASVGLSTGALNPGQAAAIVAAAGCSIAAAAAGAARIGGGPPGPRPT
jgi:Kef-type K+ transport system membrane component KefB